jgi:hypothetical protein
VRKLPGIIVRVRYTAKADNFSDIFGGDAFNRLELLGRTLISEAVVAGHKSRGSVAAQKAVPLNQERLCSASRCSQSGDQAAWTAAGNNHLVTPDNGRFQNLTVCIA